MSAALTTPAQAGSPEPVSGSGEIESWSQDVGPTYLENQAALSDYVGWINERPEMEADGFVAAELDVEHKGVYLLWKGGSDPKREALVEASRRGMVATVRSYPMSVNEIYAAQSDVMADAAAGGYPNFEITAIVGVSADQVDQADPGIVIEGVAKTPKGATTASAREAATESIEQQVEDHAEADTGVNVEVKSGVTTDAAYTRSTDYSPFNAGGYMQNGATGGTCSTGFSVRISGANYTTTARHCKGGSYRARDVPNPTSGYEYGGTKLYSSDGAARVLTKGGSAQMFDGAWNNSSGYRKLVSGFADVGLNSRVCTSGGNSGVHCNIKVTAMLVRWNDGDGSFANIRGVQQTAGKISAIQGDSGGPVLIPVDGKVKAVGMIQAIESGSTSGCGSVHDGGGNKCSKTVLFSSMRTIVRHISGASLVTG